MSTCEVWQTLRAARHVLSELLEEPVRLAAAEHLPDARGVDAVFKTASLRFAVEAKTVASSASVLHAIESLRRYSTGLGAHVIPLLIVPYMGERGASLCREARVSWLDLSGNAEIRARGLVVKVHGQPNQYIRPGRPSSLFAAKSSRIVRWMLLRPDGDFSQAELALNTQIEPGYTSKIVHRMLDDGYLRRRQDGRVKLAAPQQLLDDWYASYDFARHRLTAGMRQARSGPALAMELSEALTRLGIQHAFTGLAAAWFYTRHTAFRLATAYLASPPERALLDAIGLYEDERGANTWLVMPNDEGVFWETRLVDGLRCTHPLQAYLDLKAHPERASEAARELVRLDYFRAVMTEAA